VTRFIDRVLRLLLTGLHLFLRLSWFVRRPKTSGAHAIALTPEGKLILVKLRYARGWHVPGGGLHSGEPAVDAALRELKEEIGMISHGEVKPAQDFEESVYFKRDTASVFVVRGVRYRPHRWSWEIETVIEADLGQLPAGMSRLSSQWIAALKPLL
jgi:8-oxo-dGTP pyrophosphatase MutT (NUDIX family)